MVNWFISLDLHDCTNMKGAVRALRMNWREQKKSSRFEETDGKIEIRPVPLSSVGSSIEGKEYM